ncbi:MerR family transcriptional regulator [Rubellimicrobium aerolatum]|uniref:MerR family DNA-binding transcriptional regulator n=1 Tax=Rubellimicrobium aerolatum TaxID=490979 RepID=A0ABW0SAU9_9RHOB|nr:MerR family DNA-binding transcriptional regulator [Rubellimicrobium aerolatum]MBP1805375.1 DNA-binding transcriptional MerR regulator [Rubellimicrobium aerolatum]
MTDQTMTIREMCEQYDVTARALRFYEAKELLFPIREGTRRLFTRSDRARLSLILRGKRYGFSLEEIRQLLDLWDGGKGRMVQLERACEVAERHLAEMEAQRAELDRTIKDLKDQLAWGRAELAQDGTRANAA